MEMKIYTLLLLGFLLVYHQYSVECASLQRHIRSDQDVKLPSIQRSPDDLSVDKTGHTTKETIHSSPVTETNTPVISNKSSRNPETNHTTTSLINDVVDDIQREIGRFTEDNVERTTGKETGRSLNIDIEKYVSPEFHNKNNVYILPTSPEIQKYIDPETHDFTDVTRSSESSTPLSDLLDTKFRLVADSIKQNLEDIEHLKHEEDPEKYDVDTLIDKAKNPGNNTQVSLKVLETKTIEHSEDETKGKKSDTDVEIGKNVDYKSTFLNTKTYEDPREDEKPTEQTIESTVKKVVKEPTEDTVKDVKESKESTKNGKESTKGTREPFKSTREPAKTTREPIKTTKEPIKTTREPVKSTKEPLKTTKEPAKTTWDSMKTTREPGKTTETTLKNASFRNLDETTKDTNELHNNPNEPNKNAEEPIINAEEPIINAAERSINAEEPIRNAEELITNAEESIVNAEEPIVKGNDPTRNANESSRNANESSRNPIESSRYLNESTRNPNESTRNPNESTTMKSTKKPFEKLPSKNTTEGFKLKSSRQMTTIESFTTDSLSDPKSATDNSIPRRGSTKFVDSLIKTSTTPKGMDIDGKGFSIPPSATAWALVTLKDVPHENKTKTPTEQTVQENNIVKVTVPPPKMTTQLPTNTDIITTEKLPTTTPIVLLLNDALKHFQNTPTTEKDLKIENEIYKTSEEVDISSTSLPFRSQTPGKDSTSPLEASVESEDLPMKSTTIKYTTVLERTNTSKNPPENTTPSTIPNNESLFRRNSSGNLLDTQQSSETLFGNQKLSETELETETETEMGTQSTQLEKQKPSDTSSNQKSFDTSSNQKSFDTSIDSQKSSDTSKNNQKPLNTSIDNQKSSDTSVDPQKSSLDSRMSLDSKTVELPTSETTMGDEIESRFIKGDAEETTIEEELTTMPQTTPIIVIPHLIVSKERTKDNEVVTSKKPENVTILTSPKPDVTTTKLVTATTKLALDTKLGNDTTKLGNDTTKLAKNSTKLVNESTKIGNDSIKMGNDSTKMENDSTKLENDSTKLENDSTKMENESTKLGNDAPVLVTTPQTMHSTVVNTALPSNTSSDPIESVVEETDFEEIDPEKKLPETKYDEKSSGPKQPNLEPIPKVTEAEITTESLDSSTKLSVSSTKSTVFSTASISSMKTSVTSSKSSTQPMIPLNVPDTTQSIIPGLKPKNVHPEIGTDFPILVTVIEENNSSTTIDPSTGTEMLSHDDEEESSPGMVAAIAISSVGAICLILLAGLLIIMRKRQKRVTYGQRCRPVSLDAYSLDNVSVYNSVRRGKSGIRASKRSYGNPAFDDPVSISHQMNFQSLVRFNDNQDEITAEFEEIPQVTARANEVPPGCETKNRYANIIPLPETRVFLKASDNDPLSDYINANYVTGPKNTRGYYIACQAPMDNTIDDFWRMIWEQQSRVVLMLTNLFENGIEKCADYLPPSEVLDCHRLFGDFQITLKKRDVKEKYVISSLQLKNMVSNSWREVTHLWYMGWPERGVPMEANSLIAFLIEARSHLKAASNNNHSKEEKEANNLNISGVSGAEGGPVVVHCSPGTGRTGTVISCDIAIRDFELTRTVDVPKIVYRVRRDRASAVQTRDQYAFIYKVITLYATKLTGGALDSI